MDRDDAATEIVNFTGLASLPRWFSWRRFRRALWLVSLVALVLVLGVLSGLLADAYEWFWMNTTGQTYTSWFREDPWRYALVVAAVLLPLGVAFPPQAWARLLLVSGAFAVGYVGGHAFWP